MPLLLGGIVIWSGSTLDIPSGWQLCDGTNGTPDLRNRFVVGAGNTYSVGDTGGTADSVLVSHTHTSTVNNNDHSHTGTPGGGGSNGGLTFQRPNSQPVSFTLLSGLNGSHSHAATISTAGIGENGTGKNLPPYFALCYIQQIS